METETQQETQPNYHARVILDRRALACTDASATRYALSACQLVPADGEKPPRIVATDGACLAVVAVEGEVRQETLIPKAAFGAKKPGNREKRLLEVNGTWKAATVPTTIAHARIENKAMEFPAGVPCESGPPVDGRYPNWREAIRHATKETPTVSICLNVAKLAKIAESLGTDKVTLIVSQGSAVSVIPYDGGDGIGILMPLASGAKGTTPEAALAHAIDKFHSALARMA